MVKIEHAEIKRKIHYTYRLLYLKDVVLARILDDPTFSVLNSLIFFHQVDIVNHLQSNQSFLQQLFAIFSDEEKDESRKKEAVLFIQNCCAVSKNIQAQSRAHLYQNFIHHGLFNVIVFSLRHHDAAVRVAGTDVLVSLIDHDAPLVRSHIFKSISEKTTPLTDVLIDLLLVEVDLGVKSQMADAIKILLDPSSSNAGMEAMSRQGNSEFMAKRGGPNDHHGPRIPPQTQAFIQNFYEVGAKRLFQPLKELERRQSMIGLTVQETSLYTHLVEVLCFFVRQHAYQSKLFILSENLHSRVAQLLLCPQKYMKLIALKWFRTCIGLQDEFHNRQLIQHRLFEPILNIVYETMPRDNLLNSACLEFFEYIKRENIKQLIYHLTETYRERLMGITYVNTFQGIVHRYEQFQHPYLPTTGEGDTSFTTEPGTPDALRGRAMNGRQLFSGLKEPDADEDAYFNADDDPDGDLGDDDDDLQLPTAATARLPNGHVSPMKPLVNYPDDDDDDEMDILASSPDLPRDKKSGSEEERGRSRNPVPKDGSPGMVQNQQSPPEPLASKRRRAEVDDEDELGKMMGGHGSKRRNSSASVGSLRSNAASSIDGGNSAIDSQPSSPSTNYPPLRRKGSLKVKNEGPSNPGRFSVKPIDAERTPSRTRRRSSASEAALSPKSQGQSKSNGGS